MIQISEKIIGARRPKTKYPVLKEISERFSPRNFLNKKIPAEDIYIILEAARRTPSARNNQPWYFYWTRSGSSAFRKLIEILPDFNKWAKTAPLLIVGTYIEKNQYGINEFALYDLGASVISLMLQAKNLGYYSRQIGIFDKEKAAKIIKAEKYQKPFVIIALGEIGDYSKAGEEIINKDLTPSTRKEEIAKEI